MTDWKRNMYNLTQMNCATYFKRFNDERIYLHNIDRDDCYYSGNMALEEVIQKKQN